MWGATPCIKDRRTLGLDQTLPLSVMRQCSAKSGYLAIQIRQQSSSHRRLDHADADFAAVDLEVIVTVADFVSPEHPGAAVYPLSPEAERAGADAWLRARDRQRVAKAIEPKRLRV